MKKIPRELRLLAPAGAVLFIGLAILAGFFVAGEARNARILVEYEADRIAAALLDAYRASGVLQDAEIEPRIRAFGVYRSDSTLIAGIGSVPASLDPDEATRSFRYDPNGATLTLVRPVGMGGPGAEGMMRGTPGGRGLGMMGAVPRGAGSGDGIPGTLGGRGRIAGPGGTIMLTMDISPHYRTQRLYTAATVLAPLFVAGIAAAFMLLLASNLRYRRKAGERETLARLGESARTLAHEIRNPLGAIRIQTGLLRTMLPPETARELDVIDEEAERLNMLSRRVGDFLSSPAGVPERIILDQFLRDAARRSPHPVRLDSELPRVIVCFDRELLRSVLENLVQNAAESYPERIEPRGAETRGVEIGLSLDGPSAVVMIRDRGKGIPPEHAERVFDPFFTDKIRGSGIGLALSRRFVDAAGGALTLLPRPGGGTEARVKLPAQEPPQSESSP
jgi:signal transduction histidine kinase